MELLPRFVLATCVAQHRFRLTQKPPPVLAPGSRPYQGRASLSTLRRQARMRLSALIRHTALQAARSCDRSRRAQRGRHGPGGNRTHIDSLQSYQSPVDVQARDRRGQNRTGVVGLSSRCTTTVLRDEEVGREGIAPSTAKISASPVRLELSAPKPFRASSVGVEPTAAGLGNRSSSC